MILWFLIPLSIAAAALGYYTYKRWFGPRWFPTHYGPKKGTGPHE